MAVRGAPRQLTDRQHAVLRLVRQGLSNREIADQMDITEDGVKTHLSRLFLRYGVSNRVELLAVTEDEHADGRLTARTPLGVLRVIAARADSRGAALESTPKDAALVPRITTLRESLAEADAALGLVAELPADTTGPLIEAVRKRLAAALDALEAVERSGNARQSAP